MEDRSGLNNFLNSGGELVPQGTLALLRSLQNDYRGTRDQLEKIGRVLAEGERRLGQHLNIGDLTLRGYSNFYLGKYGDGVSINQLGKMILGAAIHPVATPKTERLEVRCLGRFEIRSSSREIGYWQSIKAREVLQYLLIKPREPVVKETIIEALWPECAPRAANNNLKAAIHSLRITLKSLFTQNPSLASVLYLQGSYRINPDINLWMDIEEFEKRFACGRRLEKDGRVPEAMFEYENAEALYRGDYLVDEPYKEWTMLRREALKDIYLFILNKLAQNAFDSAEYESCIVYCQKILSKDPCREESYRKLMSCFCRLGQKNRSLRWYEICRQTIQSEVDASPDQDTVSLYHRILQGESI